MTTLFVSEVFSLLQKHSKISTLGSIFKIYKIKETFIRTRSVFQDRFPHAQIKKYTFHTSDCTKISYVNKHVKKKLFLGIELQNMWKIKCGKFYKKPHLYIYIFFL